MAIGQTVDEEGSELIEDAKWGDDPYKGSDETDILVKNKEKRTNILHYVRHGIAIVLVGVYLVIMTSCYIYGNQHSCQLPESFLDLVSGVIGFYFGSQKVSS